jgi:hypothetical protein
MDSTEIRAEIERRKSRARELKVPETLWGLYNSYLIRYLELISKDPDVVYAPLRTGLSADGKNIKLDYEGSRYEFCCAESNRRFGRLMA